MKCFNLLHYRQLIYEFELAIFMHKVNHLKLPEFFYESFTKIEAIHSYNTRQKHTFEYFLPRANKKFTQNLLALRGAKSCVVIGNDLKI